MCSAEQSTGVLLLSEPYVPYCPLTCLGQLNVCAPQIAFIDIHQEGCVADKRALISVSDKTGITDLAKARSCLLSFSWFHSA